MSATCYERHHAYNITLLTTTVSSGMINKTQFQVSVDEIFLRFANSLVYRNSTSIGVLEIDVTKQLAYHVIQ